MARRAWSVLGLSLALVLSVRAEPATPVGETRILFIGNSLTYVNNLPAMVDAFFQARQQPALVEQLVAGGATLMGHLKNPEVAKKIASRPWTYVVLQDQSALPARAPEQTIDAGRQLAGKAWDAGAVPVFYLTWGYGVDGPDGMDTNMQQALNEGYGRVATATHARVAPVGPAWQAALAEDPQLKLHADDHKHPAPEGTYLAACVMYAVLSGHSPVGLPDTIEKVVNHRRQVLVRVAPARARFYQQIAQDAVRAFPACTRGGG